MISMLWHPIEVDVDGEDSLAKVIEIEINREIPGRPASAKLDVVAYSMGTDWSEATISSSTLDRDAQETCFQTTYGLSDH